MKRSAFALWLCPLAGLSGCASIIDGSTQRVSVQTTTGAAALPSAQCSLSNRKGAWLVTTPNAMTVHRGSEPLDVKCTRDGYMPATEMVSSSTNNTVYWNILAGGGIGATTDTVSGAAWKYPKVVTVPMQPAPGAAVTANQPAALQ